MKTPKYITAGLLAGVLVPGCVQIPQAELTRYKQAVAQVQEASETILLDYDQAMKEARLLAQTRFPDAVPAAPYRLVWKDVTTELAGGRTDDIQARRLTLKVIGEYRQMLVKSKDAMRVLTKSLSSPVDLTVNANELLGAAFRIKRDMGDFQATGAVPWRLCSSDTCVKWQQEATYRRTADPG